MKAQQLGDMLSQVCECPPPIPPPAWMGKGESPLQFPAAIGFTPGWRGPSALTGSMLVMVETRRVEYQPARPNSHPTVWQSEHTEQPQLVSPVISLSPVTWSGLFVITHRGLRQASQEMRWSIADSLDTQWLLICYYYAAKTISLFPVWVCVCVLVHAPERGVNEP